jgi:L,D-transpeptidase catalytic domain
MIRFGRTNRLPKALGQLLWSPALAAGLGVWVLSAVPAGAGFFGFPDQPAYSSTWPWRVAKPVQRRPHREVLRHRHEARHERPPAKGPFEIVIAIARQEIAIYGQDGFIARASISTGMPGRPTPMGVFSVLSKARWHQSNIYSGAPMPYMQRITWSGIAMHAGPRPGYPASHGCIRLPEDFAIWLFHTTKVGARVIVTREPVAPVAIANPKLFVPKKPDEKPVPVAVASAGATTPADVSLAIKSPGATVPAPAAPPATAAATTGRAIGSIAVPPAADAKLASKPAKPISVFVSRKLGKVFVRQGFDELFDMPVTIADPDQPIGTHVFTAMGLQDDGKAMRWNVLSIPSSYRHHHRLARRRHHQRETVEADAAEPAASTASEALERITLPPEAIERISALLVPGSSLIVSDNGISDETDSDTGFIVLTP